MKRKTNFEREQCLACIKWCPQETIQFGKKTPRYKRYHHLPPADDFVEHHPSLLCYFGSGRDADKGLTSAESWVS